MDDQPQATFDNRKREKTRRMPVEHIDGGPLGVTIAEMPHDGCRHVYGGSGLGLKMCGAKSDRRGITYKCQQHRNSYVR
jgi:hypothetical protein